VQELTEEQRRRLHQAYNFILSLRKKEATPPETLAGAQEGVAGGDTDERQSLANSTRGRSTMQESGGRQ